MRKVYVSSQLRGNVKSNISKAQWYARFVAERGHLPITPHIYFTQFLRDHVPEEREMAMEMNRELLEWCDELWVFGEVISEGMKQEIEWAKDKPIRYFTEELKEKHDI
ncbi:DUF4406 domain-containing protein [Anaerovibrio lipolyticus]|uniref:DUF7768 domain-containing protein n=1 Tax=Anaerovibrio lipolyticus TaxID=82374 RepID=UPI0026EA2EFC|nr:DUF4406 domain-containing protein [Anaerovibrio lipolyticus]